MEAKALGTTICKLYSQGYTLRHIGEIIGKDHHFVTCRLIKNGVEIVRHKTKKPYSKKRHSTGRVGKYEAAYSGLFVKGMF